MEQTLFNDKCGDLDPFEVFSTWMAKAVAKDPHTANAASVATADKNGVPSVRVLLLKFFDERGFVFFTNFKSQKGHELHDNPYAAFCLYWSDVKQQFRAEGPIEMITAEESDAYFHSRPRNSQIASIASQQSSPLAARADYEDAIKALEKQHEDEDNLPRPDHWQGFRLKPLKIEFWQDENFRAHQRRIFYRDDVNNTNWNTTLLYP